MLNGEETEDSVLAAHGRWINELQESLKMMKQEISLLEKRVSNFESETAERAKTHENLRSEISSLKTEVEILKAEIERGDDGLAKRIFVARTVPVAMMIFTIGLIVSRQLLSFLAV